MDRVNLRDSQFVLVSVARVQVSSQPVLELALILSELWYSDTQMLLHLDLQSRESAGFDADVAIGNKCYRKIKVYIKQLCFFNLKKFFIFFFCFT